MVRKSEPQRELWLPALSMVFSLEGLVSTVPLLQSAVGLPQGACSRQGASPKRAVLRPWCQGHRQSWCGSAGPWWCVLGRLQGGVCVSLGVGRVWSAGSRVCGMLAAGRAGGAQYWTACPDCWLLLPAERSQSCPAASQGSHQHGSAPRGACTATPDPC